MSVSTSKDPIQTILDILDADTSDSDWTNSKPSPIERYEASSFGIKDERQGDAVYLWQPGESPIDQQGANWDRYTETHFVQAECWTDVSATRANEMVRDVRSLVVAFATDNKSSTEWNEIAPDAEEDYRHESHGATRADHYVEAEVVRLFASRQT